jgi:hypothetical protein
MKFAENEEISMKWLKISAVAIISGRTARKLMME